MPTSDEFKLCSARKPLIMFHRDGTKARVQRCHEATAAKHGLDVLPADCANCPVRHEITKVATLSVEYQPPLVEDVRDVRHTAVDESPPENWLPCRDRNVVLIGGCCGSTMELRVCNSLECFRHGSEVNESMCRACVDRRF